MASRDRGTETEIWRSIYHSRIGTVRLTYGSRTYRPALFSMKLILIDLRHFRFRSAFEVVLLATVDSFRRSVDV